MCGEHAVRRNADRHNGRLRDLGELQIRFWPLPADGRQRAGLQTVIYARGCECVVRFFERLPGNGESIGQGPAHADLLRSLSWKDERDHEALPGGMCCVWYCGPRRGRVIGA